MFKKKKNFLFTDLKLLICFFILVLKKFIISFELILSNKKIQITKKLKMNYRSIILLLIFIIFSCGTKKRYITEDDLNRNGKREYQYNDNLTPKELKYFASKLRTKKEQITNTKLYVFIKSWESTTYLLGGENKNGIDCSSLMQELFKYVYKESLPRTSGEMFVDRKFRPLKENEFLEEGDLVFFKIDQTKIVSHVGIYLKNSKFYSASSTEGCSISNIDSNYWKKYYIGASRLKR